MLRYNGIIIEGADQQGKSTLCKVISSKMGWPIIHFGRPDESFNFHSDYLVATGTISDRNFLSEIVYSNFRNGNHRVKDVDALQQDFSSRNFLLVLVDREEYFIHSDREELFDKEQIDKAIDLYNEEFEKLTMPKLKINMSNSTGIMKIFKLLKQLK